MPIAWDDAKRATNLAKHGVDFAEAEAFDWSAALVRGDTRHAYGEVRLVAVAPIGARLHVLVCTIERRTVRIISLRKANSQEIALYEQEVEAGPSDSERGSRHQSRHRRGP